MSLSPRPIVIVTGANGGIGFGICQRLLVQLSSLHHSDAFPQNFASHVKSNQKPPSGYNGLTLIMACRNMKRAEACRAQLVEWMEKHTTDAILGNPNESEYISNFHANTEIRIEELDLASVSSTLKFAARVRESVPYVSHLVSNAGLASFSGLDWPKLLKQLLRHPMAAVSAPEFYLQHKGEISADGLGWVWQSNVFGHFILFRELQGLLAKSPFDEARVIWCSSMEASPKFYDSEDWQLRLTEHSYESSKYQIDIVATVLDHIAAQSQGKQVRHFVSEPGACSTSISNALVGPFLDRIKVLIFYIARAFNSQVHTIHPFTAAVTTIHLMLAPLCFLAIFDRPVRYGARTGRWGAAFVNISDVKEWSTHEDEGKQLVSKFDSLYETFKRKDSSLPLSVMV